ncbi:ATP-binding protein [Angustibacter aerolatus]
MQLPPLPESVRAGRHLVEVLLADWGAGELSDLAALLASELLTNAATHAGTAIDLQVILSATEPVTEARRLEIRVTDQLPGPLLLDIERVGLEVVLHHPDLDAEGGRGLAMVSSLAVAWGVDHLETGKTVWFVLQG